MVHNAQGLHRNTHGPQSIVVSGWCLLSDSGCWYSVFTLLVELNSVHFQVFRAYCQLSLCIIIGYSNRFCIYSMCSVKFHMHACVNSSAISRFISANRKPNGFSVLISVPAQMPAFITYVTINNVTTFKVRI